jgi:hypothetical protein
LTSASPGWSESTASRTLPNAQASTTGVAIQTYERAGEIRTGSFALDAEEGRL